MLQFALNIFHVRLAENKNVDEQNVETVEHQHDQQHVRNGDGDESEVAEGMIGKFKTITNE